jgi:hypothetical protein
MLRQAQHDVLFKVVMLRNEASSSPCIVAIPIEEDPSLPLRMTKSYRIDIISQSEFTGL